MFAEKPGRRSHCDPRCVVSVYAAISSMAATGRSNIWFLKNHYHRVSRDASQLTLKRK